MMAEIHSVLPSAVSMSRSLAVMFGIFLDAKAYDRACIVQNRGI